MSSAKHNNLQKGKAIRKLLTNSENKIGDKCPPWSTPDVDEKVFDLVSNNFTLCCLFIKKDPNHESRGSPKPDAPRTISKTLWLT